MFITISKPQILGSWAYDSSLQSHNPIHNCILLWRSIHSTIMVLTAASKVSRLTIVQFILLVAVVFLSPTVRSSSPEFDPLRLPTDNDGGDDSHICPQSAGPDSCPVRCFRTDPVCGVDGVTYWCGCADAHCAGTRVAKLGFCEVGIGGFGYGSGAGSVTGQALLLVHIVWLILLGIFVLFGFL